MEPSRRRSPRRWQQGRLRRGQTPCSSRRGSTGELPENQVKNLVLPTRGSRAARAGRPTQALDGCARGRAPLRALGIRRAVPPWRSLAADLAAAASGRGRGRSRTRSSGWPRAGARRSPGAGVAGRRSRHRRHRGARPRSARCWPGLTLASRWPGRASTWGRRCAGPTGAPTPAGRCGWDGPAHACGATPLAERARTELLAAGARPRRLATTGAQALTASEGRVAGLAADGLRNRRIAEELFVTTATVETHLRHAFRKLGMRSRDDLRRSLRGTARERSGCARDARGPRAHPSSGGMTTSTRSHDGAATSDRPAVPSRSWAGGSREDFERERAPGRPQPRGGGRAAGVPRARPGGLPRDQALAARGLRRAALGHPRGGRRGRPRRRPLHDVGPARRRLRRVRRGRRGGDAFPPTGRRFATTQTHWLRIGDETSS